MTCAWQVEIDDYCTKVLAKHWPDVPRYGNIREQHGRLSHIIEADGYFGGCESCLSPVDLISGGFPCQPHSVAGKRRGAEDDRNLWPEFRRVIAELRPRYVLAENVPGIITTYLDTVLSDLEGEGYTCATFNLPAVAFDAPHRRERIFIVAYAPSESRQPKRGRGSNEGREASQSSSRSQDVAYADKSGLPDKRQAGEQTSANEAIGRMAFAELERRGDSWWATEPDVCGMVDGISRGLDGGLNADEGRIQIPRAEVAERLLRRMWSNGELEHTSQRQELEQQFAREYPNLMRDLSHGSPLGDGQETLEEISAFLCSLWKAWNARAMRNTPLPIEEAWESLSQEDKDWVRMGAMRGPWWSEWPNIHRVAKGVPSRVDRLRGLGNAVVPQVAEWIGERILEFEREKK